MAATWTDISGATHTTYTPTETDEGKALRVVVTYTGESTTVSAGVIQEEAGGDLAVTLDGLIAGNAAEGAVVSVTAATDNGTDVLLSSTTSYQWQVLNGTTWTDISGATDTTYTPVEADKDKALRVVVTYAGDAAGSESTTVSAGTVQESRGWRSVCDARRIDRRQCGPGRGRQRRDGDARRRGRSVERHLPVAGSQRNRSGPTVGTGVSYTPTEADEGKALRLVVNYTDESTMVSAGVIQEIAGGDLVATLSGLSGGNAVQDTPVSVTAVTDDGTDVLSSATYSWQVSTDGFASHTEVGTGVELHADRGRRRQGAAAGGDLCRRCGGQREHDVSAGACRRSRPAILWRRSTI